MDDITKGVYNDIAAEITRYITYKLEREILTYIVRSRDSRQILDILNVVAREIHFVYHLKYFPWNYGNSTIKNLLMNAK